MIVIACNNESLPEIKNNEQSNTINTNFSGTLFDIIEPSTSKIDIKNIFEETKEVNALTHEVIYQGAGVGIIDINGDEFPDLYVVGNKIPDQLYLNNGDLTFKNITESSGIIDNEGWSTGVSIVDFDGDGDEDIYVCKHLYDQPSKRKNVLFVNNGNGKFEEKAEEYGLADDGFGIMANFFDFDKDGDLDVYVVNQPPNSFYEKQKYNGKPNYKYTNKLYRNDGSIFTNITKTAGLENFNYSLSSLTFDFNEDGLTDIFVANDYDEPDQMYQNNGNGTFTEVAKDVFRHISTFSMGSDICDINGDQQTDIYVVDMVAEDNFTQKTNMAAMNPEKFWGLVNIGYHYQYMFNSLHLKQSAKHYSEIAQLAGLAYTDWSWASLFNDMDLDGYKDLLVTNGLVKEVRNKDFEKWMKNTIKKSAKGGKANVDFLSISKKAPSRKVQNYFFKNNGDLSFSKKSDEWGITKKSWSQGAAYADLDDDGDLDFIVSNMDDGVDIYKNKSRENNLGNYLKINLIGNDKNKDCFGAKVSIKTGDKTQYTHHTPYRGFLSTNQTGIHFGLGKESQIDNVIVTFNDGKKVILTDVKANQTLTIEEKNKTNQIEKKDQIAYLRKAKTGIDVIHKENVFDDYKREVLIPYKLSSLGPITASGDVNGDGINDIYLGGSKGASGQLLLGSRVGTFSNSKQNLFNQDKSCEDGGATFGDIDNDGDLDLYVSSGGNESALKTKDYVDRLYINDGKGNFTKKQELPQIPFSSSVVLMEDVDNDNDLDIFVGSRQIPGKYGHSATSYLMTNLDGKLYDITEKYAPDLINIGMVTDAKWIDLDGDKTKELVIVGEWMPVSIFKWQNQKLENVTSSYGLENTTGMWNCLLTEDIDQDGDQDLIVGNMGLNNKYKATPKEPFTLFVDDFDNNGSSDVYLGYYSNDGVCYPVRGRQCSSEQMPFVQDKFKDYESFGTASILDVLDEKITENSVKKEAKSFAHTYFENLGNASFKAHELPKESQIAPVFDMTFTNLDQDENKELYLVGNFYDREVETTRSDAGIGSILEWKDGTFKAVPSKNIGELANYDARSMEVISISTSNSLIAIANNNAKMQFFITQH